LQEVAIEVIRTADLMANTKIEQHFVVHAESSLVGRANERYGIYRQLTKFDSYIMALLGCMVCTLGE